MKYAFIVNPASGQGRHRGSIAARIGLLTQKNTDKDISIYYTGGAGDAAVIADRLASETDEDVVLIACGGDGTVQDAANGAYGHDNAILGVMPVGSGNDFVRELSKSGGSVSAYRQAEEHLRGRPVKIDLIKMSWIEKGEERSRLIINGVNIGFDGNTAVLAHELKRLPGVSGAGSYLLAVLRNLAAKKGQKLRITADGKDFHTGKLLLVTAANGGFCGGGVNSCPDADLSDGLMELLAVRDLSRRRFISLFPAYKAGKLFRIKGIDELVSYMQAKNVIIEPMLAPTMKFVGDGEVFETGALRLEMIHDAIRVMVL